MGGEEAVSGVLHGMPEPEGRACRTQFRGECDRDWRMSRSGLSRLWVIGLAGLALILSTYC